MIPCIPCKRRPLTLISSQAVMMRRHHGRQRHCASGRIFSLHGIWLPPAVRWQVVQRKRRERVRDCGSSILHCGFPISATYWDHTGGQKIAPDMRRVCEEQGCRSDHCGIAHDILPLIMRNPPWIRIAGESERITQQRPSPPTGSTSLRREKRTILLNPHRVFNITVGRYRESSECFTILRMLGAHQFIPPCEVQPEIAAKALVVEIVV